MKICSSLKKVPVTYMFQHILTAWCVDKGEDADVRKPFIVYLASGKEGIAVGCPEALMELANAQTEDQTVGRWEHHTFATRPEEHCYTATCELAGYKVELCVETLQDYVDTHLTRKTLDQYRPASDIRWGNPTV